MQASRRRSTVPGTGLWRTKTIEQSIADTDEPETKLRRNLGAWDLTVFGVAVVIGAGIFTLTARTAGDYAGPSVSLAFVFAAIACALAALCYAEFASTVPVAGSAYTFSYATFGEFVATGESAAAGGESGVNQSLFSLLAGGSSSTFGIFGLLAGASIVFFAFIGFDIVATTAEETRDPQKAVPRGILGSLAIVTVLYVAVGLVVVGMVPYQDLATKAGDGSHKTLATAFAANGVDWAANI